MTDLFNSPISYGALPVEARALLFILAQGTAARYLVQPPKQSTLAPLLEFIWNRKKLSMNDLADPSRMTALLETEFALIAAVLSAPTTESAAVESDSPRSEPVFLEIVEAAQRWIYQQELALGDIEAIVGNASNLVHLYRDRITADHLPAYMRTPDELMSLARPPREADDVTGMEQYAHCFARWLVLCMPGDEDMQAKVCRQILPQAQ